MRLIYFVATIFLLNFAFADVEVDSKVAPNNTEETEQKLLEASAATPGPALESTPTPDREPTTALESNEEIVSPPAYEK